MKLQYKAIELPFQYPFTISGGRTKTHQSSLLVSLSLGRFTGFGEAPAISYYNVTVEEMIETIEKKKAMIEKFALTEVERYWHYLHHLLAGQSLSCMRARHCMLGPDGKNERRATLQIMENGMEPTRLHTDYTIGLDSLDKMVEKIKAFPAPIYKIKLGVENDIQIVTELRKHTDAIFRVDVNAGWTLEEAHTKNTTAAKTGCRTDRAAAGKR